MTGLNFPIVRFWLIVEYKLVFISISWQIYSFFSIGANIQAKILLRNKDFTDFLAAYPESDRIYRRQEVNRHAPGSSRTIRDACQAPNFSTFTSSIRVVDIFLTVNLSDPMSKVVPWEGNASRL